MSEKTEKVLTRQRILDAAGELFASKGFQATTIRDICDRAKANVAAVNYHFGDKERLYTELIRSMELEVREKLIESIADDKSVLIEQRLYGFVMGFLFRRLDPDRPAWKTELFHNEIMKPSSQTMSLLGEMIERERTVIMAIIGDYLGDNVSSQQQVLAAQSIIGQAFFFFHIYGSHFKKMMMKFHRSEGFKGSPIFQQISDQPMTKERIEILARHITDFSMAALNSFRHRSAAGLEE